MEKLEANGILVVMVPKNMTHLLQPLDLTTNGVFKKQERRAFSDYYTSTIMKELNDNPERDVTTIKVDTKLSTLKPLHIQTLEKIYKFFGTENGRRIIKSGFRAAGVTEAVQNARIGVIPGLDPYV